MAKLIFGCGYLGSRVGRRWLAAGEKVYAVSRSPDRAGRLRQEGYHPIVADVTRAGTLGELPPADVVLFAVGHDRSSGASKRDVYVSGLGSVVDALGEEVQRFVFISSTGVFAQTDGSLVDEGSPCEPTSESGRALLKAEELLRGSRMAACATILRLAGIYGPGRIPRFAEVASGEPINALPNAWLNLIHVDDAASAVIAAAGHERPAELLLVSDGQPVLRRAFYEELARRSDAPEPRFAPSDDASRIRERGGTDKRISNARMLETLEIRLQYPSYLEGLAAIVSG